MAIPNPLAAIVAFLQADATVTSEVGTRVYGAELPPSEATAMPRKTIVVQAAGGPSDRSRIRHQIIRVDVKGYGTTPTTAWDVYYAAYDALKQMGRTKQGTVLLYDAIPVGGPIQLRDADLEWPLLFGTFIISASEVAV